MSVKCRFCCGSRRCGSVATDAIFLNGSVAIRSTGSTLARSVFAPNDIFAGRVTPVLRRSTLDLGSGKFAVAAGDVHCTVDPLLGQGANIASHSAFVLADEIVKDVALDARFCERVEWRRQDRVLGASRWTNIMLQPPSPEMMDFTLEMNRNPLLCNEFTNNFNFSERQWDRLASAQRIRAWIEERRNGIPAVAVA
jgi:2-polyprenyl-6-methoxyphenol hydroxylase-like FAD-dependent oxidoreductase